MNNPSKSTPRSPDPIAWLFKRPVPVAAVFVVAVAVAVASADQAVTRWRAEREQRLLHPREVTDADGCQWLVEDGGLLGPDRYVHKPTCANPKHRE